MAELKTTVVERISSNNAAADPNELIRKAEFDAAIGERPTSTEMSAAIDAVAHDAVTVANTASCHITLTGQQISADVAVGAGLVIGSNVVPDFGTGHDQVSRGDHSHSQLHDAATGEDTDTATVTLTGQAVSVDVKLDPASILYSTAAGIGLYTSYFSPVDHTHSVVSAYDPGFMSPSMLTMLLSHDTDLLALGNFIDTATVEWTIGSNYKASVRYWTGLQKNPDGNGLEVDFDEVATADHTHSEYVVGSQIGQSFRFQNGNIYLWDQVAYDDDNSKPWRALVCSAGMLSVGPPEA